MDGTVEGPIQGGQVTLKSNARVVGDIHHRSLSIENGAFFDGRSVNVETSELQSSLPLKSLNLELRSVLGRLTGSMTCNIPLMREG